VGHRHTSSSYRLGICICNPRNSRFSCSPSVSAPSLGHFSFPVCSALIRASALLFTAVRVCGGAYLAFLGAVTLWSPLRPRARTPAEAPRARAGSAFGPGFLSAIPHPKLLVFFISFLPQFVPPGQAVLPPPPLPRSPTGLRNAAAERLADGRHAAPGDPITVGRQALRVPVMYRCTNAKVWAEDVATDTRRDLTLEESEAFWAWAAFEVLSRTGCRIEEMLELTHQAITSYRLPSTGELVPLLQIVPSKTDQERLLLVDPELADVLSAIICRIRTPNGSVPLVPAYDYSDKTWMPPMGLLFQRTIGGEKHAFTPRAVYQMFARILNASAITDTDGNPLHFTPHDFRRIFITDAIVNGLPPHIAQIIVGHATITTTMGYKAIYPTEALEAHRSFIARRRATRPGEEYRTPTDNEWDEFLAHFELRKLSVGTCARTFNTPCIHEHACVRCPLLRPDPTQQPRLKEIHDNLEARIIEAKREGWLGEIEGLQVSLSGAKDKLAQLDTTTQPRTRNVKLGMPTFAHIAGRVTSATPSATSSKN